LSEKAELMLIVFEGIDGSGKGDQIARFLSFLRQKKIKYSVHKYPTHKAKDALAHLSGEKEVPPEQLVRVFAEDIAKEQKKVAREIAGGDVVVCDRYLHSTLAYQAVALGFEKLERELADYSVIVPDLVVVLDIDPNESARRKGAQKTPDRFERDVGFLGKVRENYQKQANENYLAHKYAIVDATRSRDEVFSQIITQAEPFLTRKIEK
jgi:dTMP kinase